MSAVGQIRDDAVWIDDPAEASRLYSKSGVGEIGSGNVLRLSMTEAADAVRQSRLQVDDLTWSQLVQDDVEYLCYADLKERGLHVRHADAGLEVWARGERPPKSSWFTVLPMAEREAIDATALLETAGAVVAVVDEDGVVTYYDVASIEPRGHNPVGDWRGEGRLLGDRVWVEGETPTPLGTKHGDGTLLSLVEASWLVDQGRMQVEADVHAAGRQRHADFDTILATYASLRSAGVAAKSGYRFGTHLRGYARGLDEGHAEWLVQAVDGGASLHWASISRAIRLAHGVRKTFVLAVADPAVRCVSLAWKRP